MIHKVKNGELVMELGTHNELLAEASELGLPLGNWPESIALLDDANEGVLFMRVGSIDDEGTYQYRTKNGLLMTVLNDQEERFCPKCGAGYEDMVFRIDETVWCLACDWEGHEDDVNGS